MNADGKNTNKEALTEKELKALISEAMLEKFGSEEAAHAMIQEIALRFKRGESVDNPNN